MADVVYRGSLEYMSHYVRAKLTSPLSQQDIRLRTTTDRMPPRRIDRSAIGAPTSFQHTGHLGASDSHSGVDNEFDSIKSQMKSKGGYVNRAVPTDTTHKLVGADDVKVDIPKDNAKNR
ncbi:uncharacterized protein TRIADDRAFT_55151 [Trichoplax adhaerens]|uniref:CRIB domain-containing protein n=1 Tax=Trichoplax adhaerens TaxID=10228 RepID=B3RU45_TRIAD|nr:hypothetical protein TRIADDRAFT_55151 [Trichoplax adhaerens]EDV25738.1 hypothetical protein TRIADDRAFT_55151 [Trichoplax adhaerens]|eukprot:XP_002111771.1 hypothetical protein TRIADDRAFT_55151 [Trichoplax adhaerens]